MKIIKYIIFLWTLMVFIGCNREDLLDLPPFNQQIPSTVEEFRQLLDAGNGGGNWLGTAPMYDIDIYMSDDLQVLEGRYSDFFGFDAQQRIADALIWAEFYGTDQESDLDWNTLYNKINVCNLVIEYMNNPDISGSDVVRNQLIAEAQVHRAFSYWALINLYAKQYDPATAATDLGVPIKLSSAPSTNLERASVQTVYDLILEDLGNAIDSNTLPEGRLNISVRPSMASAYAILAKTHLAMGAYEEALTAANNSLQNYNALNNLVANRFLPQIFDNPELMMLKQNTGLLPISPITPHVISDELLSLYDTNDLRRSIYLEEDFQTGQITISKNPFNNTTNYLGPTVAEMFLIRAEGNARVGNLAAVSDDLNLLRQNRIEGYTSVTAYTDREIALNDVKIERRKELVGRGVRLFDLKRYNAFDNDNITLTRVIDGTTYTLEANSNRWVVPIARSLIIQNPEIEQNPR